MSFHTRIRLYKAFCSTEKQNYLVGTGFTALHSYGGHSASFYRQSRRFHSTGSFNWSGMKDTSIIGKDKFGYQYWIMLLMNRSWQVVKHDSGHVLRTTRESLSSFKSNLNSQGQKAWDRISEINELLHHRATSTKIFINSGFYKPSFESVVRAVSLAWSRSHLTVGLMALALGMNHSVAMAQQMNAVTPYHIQSQFSPACFTQAVFYVVEFMVLIVRAIYLLALFFPATVTAPLVTVLGDQFRQTWFRLVHQTLEFAGPAFIKWGQWAATRPDLFPRDLCQELSKLQSKAPTHKYSYTLRSVEKAFGRKLHDIFDEFDEEPIASGSIAQVHKATLRVAHRGQKCKPMTVAVKVRHPGVGDMIRRDFVLINWVARISNYIPGLSYLRLDESVKQFAVFMLTQVDLAREAAHLSRFLYNFRQWKDVSFPKPVYPYVHPAVLVESYEKGESVSRYVDLSERTRINSALVHIGTNTLLKMLLVDNFIHADMHPGNILVRVEEEKSRPVKQIFHSKPHVIFLDVGMTAELSSKDRVNLLDFFKAVALRNGRRAAECALTFSKEQTCPNPSAFIEEVEASFKLWGSEQGDDIHPGDCIQDLLEQVRRHRVNIDGDVCTVMVTTMVMEGWQRKLDPDYNLMSTLQSILFRADLSQSLSYTIHGIMAP